ncbi:hypothetical protein [Flavobacterium sp.]|uniref:hypothetical protein n=1 Tax=Flavobacterium sp. TaxID=239 RepID=UPI002632EF6A|nr:hypothetical protein [Flavobacterium sp.]
MKSINLIWAVLFLFSCDNKKIECIDASPFGNVLKYISAQNIGDTIEAKKYIDISKVYRRFIDSSNSSANELWKNDLLFFSQIGKDKKFTNFKYFDYHFFQSVKSNKAKVTFVALKKDAKIQQIEYSLALLDEKRWIIVGIEFKKLEKK